MAQEGNFRLVETTLLELDPEIVVGQTTQDFL